MRSVGGRCRGGRGKERRRGGSGKKGRYVAGMEAMRWGGHNLVCSQDVGEGSFYECNGNSLYRKEISRKKQNGIGECVFELPSRVTKEFLVTSWAMGCSLNPYDA
eukprot:763482-Hanusia_phi.AAC.3